MSSAGFTSPIALPRRIPADRSKALARPGVPVVACAAVVALLPLIQPGGPANSAPVDLLIGIALAAAVFWAVSSGQTWRFPMRFRCPGLTGERSAPWPAQRPLRGRWH
jgi:hypothetical protein